MSFAAKHVETEPTPEPDQLQTLADLERLRAQHEAAIAAINAEIAARGGDPTRWFPLKYATSEYGGGFTYETVRTWASERLIRSRRDGGRLFIGVDDLRRHITSLK